MCTTTTKNSKVKVEENGRKAVFLNNEKRKYTVSRIDGCLIEDGPRADYLVSKEKSTSVIIELKGTDVSHACSQLFSSIKHKSVSDLSNRNLGFLVVCARYPRFDSFIAKAKEKAAKEYSAGFHVVSKNFEYDIDRVASIDGPW